MLIDCDTCTVRGQACGECVVNLLFGQAPPVGEPGQGQVGERQVGERQAGGGRAGQGQVGEPDAERRAIQVLAAAGFEVTVLSREDLRTPLRLVPVRRPGHHAA
jgi:hypothetical protein